MKGGRKVVMVSNEERYLYLKENHTLTIPADRDGPPYPALKFSWDIWNEHPEISPKDGLDAAVDAAIRLRSSSKI